jgi:dipeptidyl aminopeptidase/acylaminoacyl peptidase
MSGFPETERLVSEWMQAAAPSSAPAHAVDEAISTTSRQRPLPRWLSMLRIPPMTTGSRALVGSPTGRLAYLAFLVLAAVALVLAGMAVGGRLLAQEPQLAGPNGLIAVDAQGDILVARPDGSDPHTITTGPDDDLNVTWSPDGTRLAFFSTPAEGGAARLAIVDPEGGSRVDFGPTPGWLFKTFSIGTPNIVWDPAGSRVATLVSGGSGTTIALVDVETGAFTPLDVGSFDVTFITWSPDGEWLGYVGQTMGREAFVIRPDGSDERSVSPVSAEAASYLSLDWSPDSASLTYTRLDDATGRHALYASDVASGSERLLVLPAPGREFWWPTYSPDGTRIASGGSEGPSGALFVMDAAGGEPARLAPDPPITTEDVTWSPDGQQLLVFAGDLQSLLIVPVGDPTAAVAIPTGGSLGSPSWQRIAASG